MHASDLIQSIIDEGLTQGMRNALGRLPQREVCKKCELSIPTYPGKYPHHCPECGELLSSGKHESVTESTQLVGLEFGENTPTEDLERMYKFLNKRYTNWTSSDQYSKDEYKQAMQSVIQYLMPRRSM